MQILQDNSIDFYCAIAFSPDGNTLASGTCHREVKLWHPIESKLLCTLSGHESWVRSVTFSPDAKALASAGFDNTIKIWRSTG
ncbi:WD40 repeat domain-containing protein [Phormidium sp. CCY1219]|uniref:WD40 repeat domain-containing protein n=1 Tax=Phormidium sp. CCY1219 TaxID=2886104 RepID=UPI002D1EC893|nr:hypothetical protein [Phormidium sp. CCY1219]MEB3827642.1 hypothetical protein [Phormidium sp. CCY1219]